MLLNYIGFFMYATISGYWYITLRNSIYNGSVVTLLIYCLYLINTGALDFTYTTTALIKFVQLSFVLQNCLNDLIKCR